jgi:nitrogen fixation protein NifB
VLRGDRAPASVPALDPGDVLRLAGAARVGVRGALVAEIDGPGDPLASAADVLRALALLRDHEPSVLAGVVVDGPLFAEYADELVSLGVHHVVLRVDAVSESVARRVYPHAIHRGDVLAGADAARLVLEEGRRALRVARWHGLPVAVRFTAIPAVNLDEVADVAALAAEEGAARMDVVAHVPSPGARLARAGRPTRGEMEEAAEAVRAAFAGREPEHGPLARLDPGRLREVALDRVEGLAERRGSAFADPPDDERTPAAILPPRRAQVVAVASTDGVEVDRTLADVGRVRIYAVGTDRSRCVGTRSLPANLLRRRDGVGHARELLAALAGCRAVVATRFTPRAATLLDAVGIRAHSLVGTVDEVLDRVARGTLRA